jgi:PAS domain S-box-containing protein
MMNTAEKPSNGNNHPPVLQKLRSANLGIVGGGQFCRKLIDFFRNQDRSSQKPKIMGVADINPNAVGLQYAKSIGILTTADYRNLFGLDGLDVILEITTDPDLAATIAGRLPAGVQLVDHYHARYLWDTLQIEHIRGRILEEFQGKKGDPQAVEHLIEQSFDCFSRIIARRNERSRHIELELLEKERAQSQIIQGSTIPTFVINQDHIVTHWNKALEKLSGRSADEVVGTNQQWAPFWQSERPTMADVILGQIDKHGIQKLYGSQWRESALIEGAYEAEVFFPRVGQTGKWLWFTAAPIKAPDGTIVGAIETLWDKTEDRKAQEDRERHARELAALCSIYTALSAPWPVDQRLEAAAKEIQAYLRAEDISIFLQQDESDFYLKYHYGRADAVLPKVQTPAYQAMIRRLALQGQLLLIKTLDALPDRELEPLAKAGFQSAAFIPISAKEKKAIGILQIASRHPEQFAPVQRHALDLIGNRLGVAIENAILHEQKIKSEVNYRSLFDNDPNPIFIISHETLEILDINERARECYGYSRRELKGRPFLGLGEPDDREVPYGLAHLAVGQSILLAKRKHFRKGGRSFYVNISVSHARYGEGDVLIATTTDVTENIEKETQLIQASKMTTLGLMAAGMAHEINQPLNVIQICADFILKMLKKGQPVTEAELHSMAKDIIANVGRASGIIQHVRNFARQSEIVTSKVCINAPIEDVFKVLGHQLKAHQIELDLNLDRDIPYVMADHNRMEQVFINLVTNAIDAMDEKAERPEHKGMVKRLNIRTWAENGMVMVSVSDNGIGMSEAVRNKLFEPFFTTKKIGKGTGLGVSISYGIIKDYHGRIHIDSHLGQGTTFILSFPVSNRNS